VTNIHIFLATYFQQYFLLFLKENGRVFEKNWPYMSTETTLANQRLMTLANQTMTSRKGEEYVNGKNCAPQPHDEREGHAKRGDGDSTARA
jgi:hypothetical protein